MENVMHFLNFAEKILAKEKAGQPKIGDATVKDISWIFVSKKDAEKLKLETGVDFLFDSWYQTKVISREVTGICDFRFYENSNVAESCAVFKITDNTVEMFFGKKKKKK